jgi:DNA-binding HxlR family transcriptional regulator
MIQPMSKRPEQHDPRQCDPALARAFDFLGKRWNGMILGTLASGPAGFAELRRSLEPITDSVLSDRLTELTAAGLINREITDTKPPGVSYALTDAGRALIPVLDGLSRWATCNLAAKGADGSVH